MKKAFFINGGAGRVLCSIPALEYYVKNTDPTAIIVVEAWIELFLASPVLRENVYPVTHKNLFKDKLFDREIVTPEPYRLNAYFTQKANMIQAYDMLINNLVEVPETKSLNLDIGKNDQVYGYSMIDQIKSQTGKDKVVVFQPFGSGVRVQGKFIIDESGRSFELKDVINIVKELSKYYAVIMFTDIKPMLDQQIQAVMPENANLLQWMSVIKAADYFIGCDSVGQHFANALNKPATVVIGSTFPENITYSSNKNFVIIDNGKDKRVYSPIRITADFFIDRGNEDLMVLADSTMDRLIKSVTNKLGKSAPKKQDLKPTQSVVSDSSCCPPPFSQKQLTSEIQSVIYK
jgi:hypothetical protein